MRHNTSAFELHFYLGSATAPTKVQKRWLQEEKDTLTSLWLTVESLGFRVSLGV